MGQILTSGVTDSAIFLLLATSFMLIMNVTRILHFAHGTGYLLGAYAGVAIYDAAGLLAAAVAALLVGAAFGLACERLVYAPLLRRSATRWVVVMSSLAVFVLGENVIGMVFGSAFHTTLDSPLQIAPFSIGALSWMRWTQLLAMLSCVVWLIVLWAILSKTRVGIFMRAVASNEQLAAHTGVPTKTVRTFAFLIGSAVAAFAGLISYLDLSAQLSMDFTGALNAVVVYIVGGMTSVTGIVVAAALLGFGGTLVSRYIGSQWTSVVVFAVLALVLLIRPQGLSFRRD